MSVHGVQLCRLLQGSGPMLSKNIAVCVCVYVCVCMPMYCMPKIALLIGVHKSKRGSLIDEAG